MLGVNIIGRRDEHGGDLAFLEIAPRKCVRDDRLAADRSGKMSRSLPRRVDNEPDFEAWPAAQQLGHERAAMAGADDCHPEHQLTGRPAHVEQLVPFGKRECAGVAVEQFLALPMAALGSAWSTAAGGRKNHSVNLPTTAEWLRTDGIWVL